MRWLIRSFRLQSESPCDEGWDLVPLRSPSRSEAAESSEVWAAKFWEQPLADRTWLALEAPWLWRLWWGGWGDTKAPSPSLLTLAAILKVHPSLRAPAAPTKASVSSALFLCLNPPLSDPRGLFLETISFYREIFISEAVSEKIQLMI